MRPTLCSLGLIGWVFCIPAHASGGDVVVWAAVAIALVLGIVADRETT